MKKTSHAVLERRAVKQFFAAKKRILKLDDRINSLQAKRNSLTDKSPGTEELRGEGPKKYNAETFKRRYARYMKKLDVIDNKIRPLLIKRRNEADAIGILFPYLSDNIRVELRNIQAYRRPGF